MASLLLNKSRLVTDRPGLRDFAEFVNVRRRVVSFKVRGVRSTCDCSLVESCAQCKHDPEIWAVALGSVPLNPQWSAYFFWALIAEDEEVLRQVDIDFRKDDQVPEGTQFVTGEYHPALGGVWLAPCDDSPAMLYRKLRSLGHLPIPPEREPDRADGIRRVADIQELVRIVKSNDVHHLRVVLWDGRVLVCICKQPGSGGEAILEDPSRGYDDRELSWAVFSLTDPHGGTSFLLLQDTRGRRWKWTFQKSATR